MIHCDRLVCRAMSDSGDYWLVTEDERTSGGVANINLSERM